jgi:hypothetical protein
MRCAPLSKSRWLDVTIASARPLTAASSTMSSSGSRTDRRIYPDDRPTFAELLLSMPHQIEVERDASPARDLDL